MTRDRARQRCRYWLACAFTTVLARAAFELTGGPLPPDLLDPLLFAAHAATVGMTMWHAGWLKGQCQGRLDGQRDARSKS